MSLMQKAFQARPESSDVSTSTTGSECAIWDRAQQGTSMDGTLREIGILMRAPCLDFMMEAEGCGLIGGFR